MGEVKRCSWVNLANPLYVAYHDEEWGKETHDDQKLFEMLALESFQAGLSWECVLNKRTVMREAFEGFDPRVVSKYGETEVERLATTPGMIRNRRKIKAVIGNARVFVAIQREYGSFDAYLWGFTGGEVVRNATGKPQTQSPLSERISEDLKRRGMTFVGPTIVYSYLQATGVMNDHEEGCEWG